MLKYECKHVFTHQFFFIKIKSRPKLNNNFINNYFPCRQFVMNMNEF